MITNDQNGKMSISRKLLGFVLFICGAFIIKELASIYKRSEPLYINDVIPLPENAALIANTTVQDLEPNLALNTKSETQHSQLHWPNVETEKFARIIVVLLKRHAYDSQLHKWQDNYWANLCAILNKIKPSNTGNIDFSGSLISDSRIASLIWRSYGHGVVVPTIKVGPGQIFRLAEVLANLSPFNPSKLSVIDPDPLSTDKLINEVLARAHEAAVTLADGTKDLSNIMLTTEENEVVEGKKQHQDMANIMAGTFTVFTGAAILYAERQKRREKHDPMKNHVIDARPNLQYQGFGDEVHKISLSDL